MATPARIVAPKVNGNGSLPELLAPSNQVNWQREMADAEMRAWEALSRYKFQMFGYWASWWVKLNKLSGLKAQNPFHDAVLVGKLRNQFPKPNPHLRRRDGNGAFMAHVNGNGRGK
jgi:hypothetical protein